MSIHSISSDFIYTISLIFWWKDSLFHFNFHCTHALFLSCTVDDTCVCLCDFKHCNFGIYINKYTSFDGTCNLKYLGWPIILYCLFVLPFKKEKNNTKLTFSSRFKWNQNWNDYNSLFFFAVIFIVFFK